MKKKVSAREARRFLLVLGAHITWLAIRWFALTLQIHVRFSIWNRDLAGSVGSLLHRKKLVSPMVSQGSPMPDCMLFIGNGDQLGTEGSPVHQQKYVSPMVFKGIPITVRFPKARNGNQETARCFTCPRTRECLFPQWFSRSAIADPSRAARHRIDSFPGSRTPPCSKRCFTNGFCMVSNNRKIPGLVSFLGIAEMMVSKDPVKIC